MKAVLAVILTALLAAPLAAASDPDPPSNTLFAIPLGHEISAEWVLRGVDAKTMQQFTPLNLRMRVDRSGNSWFGAGKLRLLVNPGMDLSFRTAEPFNDFVLMESGDRLVCTNTALAYLDRAAKIDKEDNGVPIVPLKTLAPISHEDCRLFPGGPDALYMVGRNPKTGGDDIMLLQTGGGKPSATKLVGADGRVEAVAGDGRTTYFSGGNWILKYAPGQPSVDWHYDAGKPVTGLAYSERTGLFYATAEEVGFVSSKFQFVIIKSPNPEIALSGGMLYVRLERGLDVFRIKGSDQFKTIKWSDARQRSK